MNLGNLNALTLMLILLCYAILVLWMIHITAKYWLSMRRKQDYQAWRRKTFKLIKRMEDDGVQVTRGPKLTLVKGGKYETVKRKQPAKKGKV